jgi:hypothetical protein
LIRLGYEGLFERTWTFVESIAVIDDEISFTFNPSAPYEGPYQVSFSFQEVDRLASWQGICHQLSKGITFRVPNPKYGEVRLYIEGCLAFADNVDFEGIPF